MSLEAELDNLVAWEEMLLEEHMHLEEEDMLLEEGTIVDYLLVQLDKDSFLIGMIKLFIYNNCFYI
jgi:hypothetical protein